MKDVKVADIMSTPVVTITAGIDLLEVAKFMVENQVGAVSVVDDDGRLTGILSASDFSAKRARIPFTTFNAPQLLGAWVDQDSSEQIHQEARSMRASDIMTRSVRTATEDDPISKVIQLMLKWDVEQIPIVRDNKPVGIVNRLDLLKLMLNLVST